MWVLSLGQKDPLKRKRQLTPVLLPENPIGRGAWWATVHRGVKSQTQLKQLNMGTVLIQHYYLPGMVLGEDVTASFAPH